MANSAGIKIEIEERLLIDSQKLSAVVKWLEANQPDVFRRGLWDAIAQPVQPEPAVNAWQPIETAPKHTEVLVWREDSGPFIAKLTTPDAVITEEEMERHKMEFPDDFEEWWSDAYGWQEGSEKPTNWMPLPSKATS